MQKKVAIISGVSGQDGAFLASFLLEKSYNVIGVTFDASDIHTWRIKQLGISDNITLVEGNITDKNFIEKLIKKYTPDEYYNLAAISSVRKAWGDPEETFNTNALAVISALEIIKNYSKYTKFFQASSANIFGDSIVKDTITESYKIFSPIEPYGVAKLAAHLSVRNMRDHQGLFCVNGILYNHESELRADNFVFKKVVNRVIDIAEGIAEDITLGNLDVLLDWGYAKDYVEAMWLMLQHDKPEDFIICTGKQYQLRDLVHIVFNQFGITNYERYIKVDPLLVRKKDVVQPKGSNQKIKKILGWEPKVTFLEMIQKMIKYEMDKNK